MAVVLWLGNALAVHAQTTAEYIHTDALGTPIAVTDANKMVIEAREYEPYGLQVAGPVKDGPGYTGHVQDVATGLTYMQQRYMDPVLGVFQPRCCSLPQGLSAYQDSHSCEIAWSLSGGATS